MKQTPEQRTHMKKVHDAKHWFRLNDSEIIRRGKISKPHDHMRSPCAFPDSTYDSVHNNESRLGREVFMHNYKLMLNL